MTLTEMYRQKARRHRRYAALWAALALISALAAWGHFMQGEVGWGWVFVAGFVIDTFLALLDLAEAYDNARRAEWWARIDGMQ